MAEQSGPPTHRRLAFGSGSGSGWGEWIVPLVFVAIAVLFTAMAPRFMSATNITNVLNQVSVLAVVTIGATVVILAGGFDLSSGAIVALAGVCAAMVVQSTGSVGLGLAAGVGVGVLVGVINGVLIGYLKISPLIVTLGALNACRGFALVAADGAAVYSFPAWFAEVGAMRFVGLPVLTWFAFLLFVLVAVMLRHTTLGLDIYAVGGNPRAARLSGVDVARTRLVAFAISGAMAGIAGMMLCARTGGGEPTAGYLYELEAIAAVVLGGAALAGGEGKLWRSMLGILLLTVIGNGLNIVGVHAHWKGVFIGVILVVAAAIDAARRKQD